MNEKRIWAFLMERIGNPFGVAGLMGNLYAESGLRPNNLQNTYEKKLGMSDASYTEAVDNGSYTNFVRDSAGYGLAQWTYWSRKQNLLNFAKERGSSIGDLDMQLGFLMQELAGYSSVLQTLKTAASVREASDAVLTKYERPADQSDAAKARRASYGQKYYDKYATVTTPEANVEEGDTMTYDPKKVIDIALAEVGYLEKETNSQLDDKTANAGDENYTKYARDLDALGFYNGRKQHVAWCDVFVDHSFVEAYGMEVALAITFQPYGEPNCGAGCKYSRQYYQMHGRLFDTPEPGDQIFFFGKTDGKVDKSVISHTGLVYAVDSTYVYTVEGNTSSASGVVANGGAVAKKKYKLNYERLAGFGRPDYGMTISEPVTPSGSSGSAATSYKLGDRTLKKGDKGDDVAALQSSLLLLDYHLGNYGVNKDGVDGSFGSKTDTAVRSFQSNHGLEIDGKYGKKSHAAMLEALAKLDSEPDETPVEQPETSEGTKILTIVCGNGGKVNLRAGDSTEYGSVGQADPGTVLGYVVTSPTGWHGVRYKERIAWVSPKYSAVTTG